MRVAVPPVRSADCLRGAHGLCSHRAGVRLISLWRRRPVPGLVVVVCTCACHAGCVLAGRSTVAQDEWRQACACAGAQAALLAEERREAQRRDVAAVYAEARRRGEQDAGQIERSLRVVLGAGDRDAAPGVRTASRIAAASNARRGTRRARLLVMGVRGFVSGVRWTGQRPVDRCDDHDRSELSRSYRLVGGMAAGAALVTVVAVRSSGRRRVARAAVAALAWLPAAVGAAVTAVVTQVVRAGSA